MGTISDKLMMIINTKEDIRQALISKGYDVPTSIPFKEYAKMILDLPCNADSFPDIEGIVARYSASGLTNEQMAANPVWKDLTGNGHDLQMKNFLWAGMSGVGGYSDNFSSDFWEKPSDRSDITWTSSSFNITRIMNTGVQIYYHSAWEESESVIPEKRIIVKGLEDGQVLRYMNVGNRIIEISQDGIYTIPSFTFKGANFYHGYSLVKKQESCNVTVEQLPLYPGALVFDGVDDYGICENFPILTKEKGYTVVALRQFISDKISSLLSKWTVAGESGAFIFEGQSAAGSKFSSSFGHNFYGLEKTILSYMTSTSYNGNTIVPGDKKDTNNNLVVGRFYSDLNTHYVNAAIWEIVILDHDATEEELTKIKDYFVKTYPWLFPNQAWTVVGKTNEDEDRATIANITGNGNDLVLSNFGFAEGSGYGLYKTPFELYPSVQHSSKYSLSFSKFALGDHNLIIAPKQNDLSYDIKVKVTGLKDGVKFKWGWIGTTGYIDITTDGIHMLNKPASQIRQLIVEFAEDFDPDHVVTIEQIPEYEGYLVTDGVDDRVQDSSFKLNKDWTLVGEWVFLNQKATNAGITKPFSFVVYNRTTGLSLFINTGTSGITIENVKSIKAICSDGRIYFDDWSEMLISKDQDITSSTSVLSIGFNGTAYTQMAFKNLGIYNDQLLSKDDCIKAYNYLQTLKSK